MNFNRRLILLLTIGLTVLGLSQIAAQDATPISAPPTETLVPTLLPTEIPTDLPSETPLPTLTPTLLPPPSETPTDVPTPTESETPTLAVSDTPAETATETPTLSASESPAPTLTVDASLSPSPSSTITLTPSMTASATATSVFPTAQPLTLLFNDNFDAGDVSRWTLGPGWGLVASEGGQALQTTTDAPLMLTQPLGEAAAEARLQFSTGTVQLTLRQGASGSYAVQFGADGQVKLLVTGQVVTSTTVAANQAGQWRTLRLTAANSYLRVAVDGVEVLAALDAAPLPPGTLTIAGIGTGTLLMDDVSVFISPITPVVLPTDTATAMSTATSPTLPTLYTESFENPQFNQWFTDIRNSIVSVADGHALHVVNANSYLSLSQGNVLDVVFQADINLSSGIASFGVRHSGAGYYRVALNANGTISLYRTEQALATTVMAPFVAGQWRTVKLSVIGNTLRVVLDNVEVLNFTDTSPLPSGTMFVAGNVETVNDFLLDNLVIQGTITPLQTQSSTTNTVPLNQRRSSAQMLTAGSSERIVFSKNVNTSGIANYHIFIMDDCGNNQIQLTNDFANHFSPDLDLNGHIAFVGDGSGNHEIYTMNYDGTALEQRTFSSGSEQTPSLAPDGSDLVFESGGELFTLQLPSIPNVTFPAIPLTGIPGYKVLPKWSPNDNRIAFHDFNASISSFNIFTVNSDSSQLTQLTTDNHSAQPNWSPDSSEIVFKRGFGGSNWLDAINLITRQERHIIAETTDDVQMPTWSIDGSTILYTSIIPSSPYYYMNTVSSQVGGLNGLGVQANSAGCSFGRLPAEGDVFTDYGLVPSVQVTPAPNATSTATPIDQLKGEECNPDDPYWRISQYNENRPRPRNPFDVRYDGHHGMPKAYMEALLSDLGYNNETTPVVLMPEGRHILTTNRLNELIRANPNWLSKSWAEMLNWAEDMFTRGQVPPDCQAKYWLKLKEYLKALLCALTRAGIEDAMANDNRIAEIVNWLGGIDAILADCS